MAFDNTPAYLPLGEPTNWVTDKFMPMIRTGGIPTCRMDFYIDSFRFSVRAHYTEKRMEPGYHMNDNKIPPFYWSKPR